MILFFSNAKQRGIGKMEKSLSIDACKENTMAKFLSESTVYTKDEAISFLDGVFESAGIQHDITDVDIALKHGDV
jgi:hypothetical protein